MKQPEKYHDNEEQERLILASLQFVGASQSEYVLNKAIPIAKVRSELHRVYPEGMASFDALFNPSAPPKPRVPTAVEMATQLAQIQTGIAQLQQENAVEAAQRAAKDAEQLALDGAFGIAARGGVSYSHGVQSFGAPVRAGAQSQAEPPPQPRPASASPANVQTFGTAAGSHAADQARIAAAAAKLARAPIASGDAQRQRDLDAAFGLNGGA